MNPDQVWPTVALVLLICGLSLKVFYRLGYHQGKMDAFEEVKKHKVFDVLKDKR